MPSDLDALLTDLRGGDRRSLARLLTILEDGTPEQRRRLLAGLPDQAGTARTVGITGPPGVGKSTLVDALTTGLRAAGRRVAVLAVDPSSPVTGGALLGDRVRMQRHAGDPGVFVRSMAARGQLGGLAASTARAAALLGAAGFEEVLVETVGVGQSEVVVAGLVDTTVVVLSPALGDDVQAAKAGLLEVADLLVVNKGDLPGADTAEAVLRAMLELAVVPGADAAARAWVPPVVRTDAVRGTGVPEVLGAIEDHRRHLAADTAAGGRRQERARALLVELVLAADRRALLDRSSPPGALLEQAAARLAGGEQDADGAVEELLGLLRRPVP